MITTTNMALLQFAASCVVVVLITGTFADNPGSVIGVLDGSISGTTGTTNGCQHTTALSVGCCAHIEEDSVDLNATVCVNMTLLSHDIGISLTASVNDYVFVNKTVSLRNPPPICVETPYLHVGSLCVILHDLDVHLTSLHVCVAVEAVLKHVTVKHAELGCFTLGEHGIAGQEAEAPRVRMIK